MYDQETGLYYLQSRYYNPEIGRFINADAFTSTGQDLVGNNMFAYCGNNPVCRIDLNGEWWRLVNTIVAVVSVVNIVYSINNWAHTKHNQSLKVDGYIYNQSQGIAAQYKFGFFRSDHNGCGWIATYNALIMLDDPQTPDKIISYYEKRGALFWGGAGINPTAVAGYFRSRGYTVKVSYNTSNFDKQAKSNTANILFYWHSEGAHNIAVQWDGRRFVGYNITSWDSDPIPLGTSLAAWLKTNGFTGPMLTSIS